MMKDVKPEDRKEAGKTLNELKQEVNTIIEEKKE